MFPISYFSYNFRTHALNLDEALASRIREFASQIFVRTAESINFIEKFALKIFLGVVDGKNKNGSF